MVAYPFNKQAATPVAGVALVNGTPSILTWTAPADGAQHRVSVLATLDVTSTETGGAVGVTVTAPDGTSGTLSLFAGAHTAALYGPVAPMDLIIESGSTVTIAQTSALTGGAATVWAEIWGQLCRSGFGSYPARSDTG
jgi:hypothetical protein